VLLACAGARAAELWERNWIEVTTQHFVFVSALNEDTTIRYAKDLENFRTVVEFLTNIGQFEGRVPTRVVECSHQSVVGEGLHRR
jgi:hypothetical protein